MNLKGFCFAKGIEFSIPYTAQQPKTPESIPSLRLWVTWRRNNQATIRTPTQGNLQVRFPINARNHPIPIPIDRVSEGGGLAVNIFPLLKSKRHLSDQ